MATTDKGFNLTRADAETIHTALQTYVLRGHDLDPADERAYRRLHKRLEAYLFPAPKTPPV